MRTIQTKVYKYAELSEDAKEKARNWYREGEDFAQCWEYVQEDAKEIGLKICSLDQHRANSGDFITTAVECAEKIIKNHGDVCETYKTAAAYLKDRATWAVDDDGDFVDEDAADEATTEFLDNLLEDYRIIYEKDIEYNNSDEAVAETIEANDYEFTEEGERV